MATKKLLQRNVTHVVFDPDNPEHKAALKHIAALGGDRANGGESENTLIQFFRGKPVGFTDFQKDQGSLYVDNMYLLPEYRDVIARVPLTSEEGRARDAEFHRILAKHTDKRLDELPRPIQRKIEAIRLAKAGLELNPARLGLARKMARYLAKKHSARITFTADHLLKETIGEDISESVRQRYTNEYFKRRASHQPRGLRQQAKREREMKG